MTDATPPLDFADKIVKLARETAVLILIGYLAWYLVPFIPRWATNLANAQIAEVNLAGGVTLKLATSTSDLQSAQQQISTLQQRNDELTQLLAQAKARADDPALKKRLAELETENSDLRVKSLSVQTKISATIDANIPAVENTAGEKRYYVIALTSTNRKSAEDEIVRVQRETGKPLKDMFPNLEVYGPANGPYTILMSRDALPFAQASQLKQRAIGAGFSRDTWLWQSSVSYFDEKRQRD